MRACDVEVYDNYRWEVRDEFFGVLLVVRLKRIRPWGGWTTVDEIRPWSSDSSMSREALIWYAKHDLWNAELRRLEERQCVRQSRT